MTQLIIHDLLQSGIQKNASDVHLVVGRPPIFRIHGELFVSGGNLFSSEQLQDILFSMIDEKQKNKFLALKELDFAYSAFSDFQFRVNLYMEKGNVAATIRIISTKIRTIMELGLPPIIDSFAKRKKGMIILSGTAGSGKSTTLNYVLNQINNDRRCKVVTIEDPIEYIHHSKQSLIVQREVGSDTETFANALKYALRQDPDVVVIGEMRDLESISMAMTTAETGHLVITTVHAPDAVETINRIIDVFPTNYREQVCMQLAENLVGVVGQILIPKKDSIERVLATEVIVATLPVRNIIRRGAMTEIRGQMDAEADSGMHTYEKCLSGMVRRNIISLETAKAYSKNPHLLKY